MLEAQATPPTRAPPDGKARVADLRRPAIVTYDKSISINKALQQRLIEERH